MALCKLDATHAERTLMRPLFRDARRLARMKPTTLAGSRAEARAACVFVADERDEDGLNQISYALVRNLAGVT